MYVCAKCGSGRTDAVAACDSCGGPVLPLRSREESLSGRVVAGKYRLLEVLGRGGMGVVYLAEQLQLERPVALKVLRVEGPDRARVVRRFYAEAAHSSRLCHPHNVRVFDFGHTEDGDVFIVMERVDGRPLAELELPMPAERALRIVDQIAMALGEAHGLGLVHRDLKPDNVMVSQVDGRDFVRVLDYGVAKSAHAASLTGDRAIVGTPMYMAPEQADGGAIDARTDIYALGLILYELVTGRPPFDAETSTGVLFKHKYERTPLPSAFAQVSAELEALILDCLAKSPEDRPATAEDLRARLAAVQSGDETALPAPDRDRPRTLVSPRLARRTRQTLRGLGPRGTLAERGVAAVDGRPSRARLLPLLGLLVTLAGASLLAVVEGSAAGSADPVVAATPAQVAALELDDPPVGDPAAAPAPIGESGVTERAKLPATVDLVVAADEQVAAVAEAAPSESTRRTRHPSSAGSDERAEEALQRLRVGTRALLTTE